MDALPRDRRQMIGCGFEPAFAGATPWQPPITKLGYRHPRPTVCAGFTTRLPEVLEVARAHTHWSKGSLHALIGKDEPNEILVAGIEILNVELSHVELYALTPKKDGGGRE